MLEIKNLLYSYIYNSSNENRLALADSYYKHEQYAAALSYYLQTADQSTDKDMQYYCLIRCGKCFQVPGNRKHSIMTLYKHAINLLPNRPEAYYYLSQVYEWAGDWFDCYTISCLGLLKENIDDIYSKKLGYDGKRALIFQKALSAWWIGRGDESRELHKYLLNNCFNELEENSLNTILNNLKILYPEYHG